MQDCNYTIRRQRYLVRRRDPATLQPIGGAAAGTWHDFVGDEIYGDFDLLVTPGNETTPAAIVASDRRSYLSGVGYDDYFSAGSPTSQPVYEHGDQIGTNRRLTATDNAGSPAVAPLLARSVYSAFGEPLDQTAIGGVNAPASFKRGYAGAWGYQAGDAGTVVVDTTGTGWGSGNQLTAPADPMTELGWLHVGERYYDPASGRFVMRDPIGIRGGLNTYAYTENNPVLFVDPKGLSFWWPMKGDASPHQTREYYKLAGDCFRQLYGDPFARQGIRAAVLLACTSPPGLVIIGGSAAGVCLYAAVERRSDPRTGSHATDGLGWLFWKIGGVKRPPGYRPY